MKHRFALFALVLAVPALSAQGRLPNPAAAGKSAADWIRKNNKFGPNDRMANEIADNIRKDINDFNSVTLIVGEGVTKSGKPQLLLVWAGKFFTRTLTLEQARGFDVKPMGASYRQGTRHRDRRAAESALRLSK